MTRIKRIDANFLYFSALIRIIRVIRVLFALLRLQIFHRIRRRHLPCLITGGEQRD